MNFKVKTYNAIAETGISLLNESKFDVSEELKSPDALLLRSFKLTEEDIEEVIDQGLVEKVHDNFLITEAGLSEKNRLCTLAGLNIRYQSEKKEGS